MKISHMTILTMWWLRFVKLKCKVSLIKVPEKTLRLIRTLSMSLNLTLNLNLPTLTLSRNLWRIETWTGEGETRGVSKSAWNISKNFGRSVREGVKESVKISVNNVRDSLKKNSFNWARRRHRILILLFFLRHPLIGDMVVVTFKKKSTICHIAEYISIKVLLNGIIRRIGTVKRISNCADMSMALQNVAWNGSWLWEPSCLRPWLSPLPSSSECSSTNSALSIPFMRCTFSHLINLSKSVTRNTYSIPRLAQDALKLRKERCLQKLGASPKTASTSQLAQTDRDLTRLSARRSSPSTCPTSCMTQKTCQFTSPAPSKSLTLLTRWRQCSLWSVSVSGITEPDWCDTGGTLSWN